MSETSVRPEADSPSVNSSSDEGGTVEGAGERGKVRGGKFRLTMEIPFFFVFFSVSMSGAVINNMLLERACLHSLGYNETVCAELIAPGNKSAEMRRVEEEVQSVTTLVVMVKAMVEGFVPAVLSLFLGVWSNTHGRKPLVVWPLFGLALSSVLTCAYSLLGTLGPWWYAGTALPFSLAAGGSALFTGAFCYLSDITHDDNRSFRLALLESSVFVGTILGSLASAPAVAALGAPPLLLFTACLAVAAYVYTNLCIEESVEGAVGGGLSTVFDTSLVRDMFRTCFKRRPGYDRAVVLILVCANSVSIFVVYGLFEVDYLYAREKLQWDLPRYSVYSATNTALTVAGLALGVTLQRRARLSDAVVTLAALASSAVDALVKALATAAAAWLMYFASSISLLRGLASPLIRSLISKREAPQDVAKVFALMSALEAVLPVLSPPAYSLLYKYTLRTLPGAVYIMTTSTYGACLAAVGVAQYFMVTYPTPRYTLLES